MTKIEAIDILRKRGYIKGKIVNNKIITCNPEEFAVFYDMSNRITYIYGAKQGQGGPRLYKDYKWIINIFNLNPNTKTI